MFDIMNFLDTKPIKLVEGVGTPETGGCWMAAISMYAGESWGDQPECVCDVIATLCVSINDDLSNDEERGRIIGPVLLDPVGTECYDRVVVAERIDRLIEAAITEWAPMGLDLAGDSRTAEYLRGLKGKTGRDVREGLKEAIAEVFTANPFVGPVPGNVNTLMVKEMRMNVLNAADGYRGAAVNVGGWSATTHGHHLESFSGGSGRADFIEDYMIPVVKELCAIGTKVPVEQSCTLEQFAPVVQVGE